MPELLTPEELSEHLKIGPSRLRLPAWRRKHGLRAVRVGRLLRFDARDVEVFLERRREVAAGLMER